MPDNAVDYTRDICDFCERVVATGAEHVCPTMPIARVVGDAYPSYETLVACFGEIVVSVADNDYQGDTRYLLRAPDGRWGILINGWGSCSGCDALEACSGHEDLAKLREGLGAATKWFDTAAACREYIEGKDWETEFHHREPQTSEFIERTLAALGATEPGREDQR